MHKIGKEQRFRGINIPHFFVKLKSEAPSSVEGVGLSSLKKIENKLGQALGSEKAIQQAIELIDSRKLLKSKLIKKIFTLENKSAIHEYLIQELIQDLLSSKRLNYNKIKLIEAETVLSESLLMERYLGDKPNQQKALEYLCFAEMFQIMNYKILIIIAKLLNDRHFKRTLKSILKAEKNKLNLCTKMAKKNALSN